MNTGSGFAGGSFVQADNAGGFTITATGKRGAAITFASQETHTSLSGFSVAPAHLSIRLK